VGSDSSGTPSDTDDSSTEADNILESRIRHAAAMKAAAEKAKLARSSVGKARDLDSGLKFSRTVADSGGAGRGRGSGQANPLNIRLVSSTPRASSVPS
jgi:hypothetical protein